MDRVNPARDVEAILVILSSLEEKLAFARARGDNLELIDEIEQTVKEIRQSLPPK